MAPARPKGSICATAGDSLGRVFLAAAERHAGRAALEIGDEQITYATLAERAGRLAAVLADADRPAPRLGAVFCARTLTAYEGVLGTLLSGAGYVPLNPKFPDVRNLHILESSGSPTLVVDEACAERLAPLLDAVTRPLLVVLPTRADVASLRTAYPRHRFAGRAEVDAAAPIRTPPAVDPASIAYLLFTSGSTGAPKGVMVSHHNALAFIAFMWERYQVTEHDRFSQMFDLTFDVSVFDLFACWGRGAALLAVPERMLTVPDEYIRAKRPTIWFSVPSVAMVLRRFRKLKPGVFPSLRVSLFAGERLPVESAAAWQAAAPASIVDNHYGPTETTIACTFFPWDPVASPARVVDGVVPIGRPYPAMASAVVSPSLELLPPGQKGELCMRGPQVTPGYWQDPARTADRYVAMPWDAGPENRWYRTGDLAYVDDQGDLVHCGRTDDQIKLNGYRIELPEVEHALREVSGSELVAVVPYPFDEIGPTGLTGVVTGSEATEAAMLAGLAKKLPAYMVPREVVFFDELPLNSNGKIDKKRCLELLRAQKEGAA